MRAVDLSNNNWPLPLADIRAQMAAEGNPLGAVILKLTEGVTYIDNTYAPWKADADALGLPVVAYHCIWDTGNGAAQAQFFLDHAQGAAGLMLDWERFGPAVAQTPTVLAFMARVDLDPRPKFMYAAGWIFGWPGVTRAVELSRWPLITPDPTPTLPWSSMVLRQNPQGYYVVDGKQIDDDVVVSPGFFEALTPTKEPHMADYTCTIDGNEYAVSPGGVMPLTGRMLSAYAGVPSIGDISIEDVSLTRKRHEFYIAHGRWLDANGNDPGPREAKGLTAPAPGPVTLNLTGTFSGTAK